MTEGQMRALLDELDQRLQEREVPATIFVVGGAAMTMAYGRQTLTPDIDALISNTAVVAEASKMADEHRIPKTWLNGNAQMFMPSLPSWALRQPSRDSSYCWHRPRWFLR